MSGLPSASAPQIRVILGLAAVYVLWGSTYPAIRVMVETVPPLLGTGMRYLVAGTAFAVWLLLTGRSRALRFSRGEVAWSFLVGAALVAGGTGLVAVGERDVPSGVASLIFASAPLWVVLLRGLAGETVRRVTLGWVVLGFAGVAFLFVPGETTGASLGGLVILVGAAVAWATGSFVAGRVPLPRDLLAGATLQMLLGGLLTTAAALLAGEAASVRAEQVSWASAVALAYLVIAGTLAAYTAYVWLLAHAPVSRVMTFAYANPVVAVAIGASLLGEQLTHAILAGSALILASVAGTLRSEP